MSITDELREWANGSTLSSWTLNELTAIADRIDAEHEKACAEAWDNGYESDYLGIEQWMTEHPQVMEQHGWVKGPLDADGEMWRRGDMSDSNWGVIEGIAYEDGRWLVSGHDTSAPWVPADSIRHHHAPTVEDVLRDVVTLCRNTWKEESAFHFYDVDDVMESGNIAEYAAKLRLREDA